MRSVADRLLSKVEMDPNGGCWLWSGSHDRAGYGRIRSEGRLDGVHRVSYGLFVGPIGGQNVLHRCDVRCCCNPEHLFLGTQADNVADMYAKGRGNRPSLRGDRSNNRKLTSESVREARALRKSGYTWLRLSQRYSVSVRCIRLAVIGKERWVDV